MIKHILSDGTELFDITGRVVPATGKTEVVYRIVAEYLVNHHYLTNRIDTDKAKQYHQA